MNKSAKKVLIASLILAGTVSAPSARADGVLSTIAENFRESVKNMPLNLGSLFGDSSSSRPQNGGGIPRAQANMDAARYAIANSTNESGEASRTAAFSDANCKDIKKTAKEARVAAVQRYTPPSPTFVIRDTTCFVGIISIKIPETGMGWLDQHLNNLVKLATDATCKATNGYWNEIKNKVSIGTMNDIFGSAINAGTKYIEQKFDEIVPPSYLQMPTTGPVQPPLPVPGTLSPVVVPPGGWGRPPVGAPPPLSRQQIIEQIRSLTPVYNNLATASANAQATLTQCIQQKGPIQDGHCAAELASFRTKSDAAAAAQSEIERLQDLLESLNRGPRGSNLL